MQLPDSAIRQMIADEVLVINPYDPGLVQPASIDVRLGHQLRTETGTLIDINEHMDRSGIPFMLAPDEFMLAHTEEYIEMPSDVSARVEGKSTIGRRGLAIHTAAGFIDPSFKGQITLELKNFNRSRHIALEPGMLIAQIAFYQMLHAPEVPYGAPKLGSHYQGQTGPTPAWREVISCKHPGVYRGTFCGTCGTVAA